MTRKREGGQFARADDMTPEWRKYWEDPSAPHPDALRPYRPVQAGRRANPMGQGYCHHYRQADEHYHSTMAELEACPE